MQGSPDQLRRWVEGRRAAERREWAEPVVRDAKEALAAALRLIALARERHGWPLPVDRRAAEEDRRVWDAWARLRRVGRA